MDKYFSPLSNVKRLHIEMGYFCNIRCIMCYQHNYTKKLPSYVWKKKLLPLYPTIEELNIQGGEATAMPEVRELVSLVKKNNPKIRFNMTTNGLLFDDFWQDEFIKNGFFVNFSINAATKKTYQVMTKYSDYEKVIGNLKKLIKKRNSTNSPLLIFISFVVRPENINELTDFIKLGKELGVNSVRIYIDIDNLIDDPKLVEDNVKKAWNYWSKNKINLEGLSSFYKYYCYAKKVKNIFSDRQDDSLKWGSCTNHWQEIYVNHAGEVKICCRTSLVLGDLTKGGKIEEIWNNANAKKIRKFINLKNYCYCRPTCTFIDKSKLGFSLNRLQYKIEKYWNKFKQNPIKNLIKLPKKILKLFI